MGIIRSWKFKVSYASSDSKNLFVRDCGSSADIDCDRPVHPLSILPAFTSSLMSFGERPSTWHPTLNAVPKISSTVPFNPLESDLLAPRIVLAISMISSRGMDLECLMFFSFFRSRGGSFRALMTRDEAEGTTDTAACRFWMVKRTVTRRPFCRDMRQAFSRYSLGIVPSRQ